MDYSALSSIIISCISLVVSIITHLRYSKCLSCIEIEMKQTEENRNVVKKEKKNLKIRRESEEKTSDIDLQEITISEPI